MSSILNKKLLVAVRERFTLNWDGIHGAPHWARVRVNGLSIAAITGARTDVIELFSFLHDRCRENDGHDPFHGPRAVDFANVQIFQHSPRPVPISRIRLGSR